MIQFGEHIFQMWWNRQVEIMENINKNRLLMIDEMMRW